MVIITKDNKELRTYSGITFTLDNTALMYANAALEAQYIKLTEVKAIYSDGRAY